MTAALRKPAPHPEIAEAAPAPARRPGRPKGARSSPLARWLVGEAARRKHQRYTARDAFFILQTEEEPDGPDGFVVSDETADAVWSEVFGDIRGRRVSWEWFRKIWRQA